MCIQCRVEDLNKLVKRGELCPHAGLVADEVSCHALHEADECPESNGVVLEDCVEWGEEV